MPLRRSCLTLLLLAGIAGCGGASHPVAQPGTKGNPSVGKLTAPTDTGRSNEAAAPATAPAGAAGAGASERSQRPCSLVTRSQAAAIVGTALAKPVTAPKGPTCIYRAARDKRLFSLAVPVLRFDDRFRRQLGRPQRLKVSNRPAYCATSSQPTLYIPLDGGRVLIVTAPCVKAQKLAAVALRTFTA
ncbi:DUF3558 family protein [Candidatus Solirubrobacter pratensis]|uniref:DUF3558 family protein n=1 Tax=Candidatus Solirubrobacter pratensis TaxID=1298857 RepID=UPI000410AFF4|nr:DUF3558 family protein [Candidatus Solirubrobacter pratensis]